MKDVFRRELGEPLEGNPSEVDPSAATQAVVKGEVHMGSRSASPPLPGRSSFSIPRGEVTASYSTGSIAIGTAWMVFAAICIAGLNALFKQVSQRVPVFTVTFYQYLFAFLMLAPFMIREGWREIRRQPAGLHFFRAFLGITANLLSWHAVKRVSMMDAMLLFNTGPLWVPFAAWIWLKTPLRSRIFWGIIPGFLGVALILHPTSHWLNPGLILALTAGVLMSVVMVALKALARSGSPFLVSFYYLGISAILLFPLGLMKGLLPTGWDWALLVAMGVLMLLPQVAMTMAMRFGPASAISPSFFMVVVFTGFFGWLFWNEIPDLLSIGGAVLVTIGVLICIATGSTRAAPKTVVPRSEVESASD